MSDGATADGGGVAVRASAEATPMVAAMMPISTTASRISGRRSPPSVIAGRVRLPVQVTDHPEPVSRPALSSTSRP